MPGFQSRQLSFGTEVRLVHQNLGLALRAGTFMNLGSGQDDAPTVTGGFDLKLWNFHFEVAGGVSTKRTRFESIGGGDRIPIRGGFSAQLSYRVPL